MKCRWECSYARKMFIFGSFFLLILIRHTISFESDYRFVVPRSAKQNPRKASHQYSGGLQETFTLPHPHRHRHNFMRDNGNDLEIELQKLQTDNYYKMRAQSAAQEVSKVHKRYGFTSRKYARLIDSPIEVDRQTRNIGLKTFKNKPSDIRQRNDGYNWIHNHLTKKKDFFNKTDNAQNIKSKFLSYYHKLKNQQSAEDYHKLEIKMQNRDYIDFDKLNRQNAKEKLIMDNNDNDFQYDYLDDEPQIYDQISNFSKTESLTDEKWKNYGTPEAVEKSRRRYAISESQSAATAHIQRIKEDSKCRWPHPKIVSVTEASKRFVPHCTILHRCGDDTGCCDYDTKTCVAKVTNTVHLHFFVIPLAGSASVEVRSFVNHTECHCVDRCILTSCLDSENIVNQDSPVHARHLNGSEVCRCPSHYDVDQDEFTKGRCRCDCFNYNQGCKALKEGLDGFPGEDQKCILEEKCQIPVCQYGRYNSYTGRCPNLVQNKRNMSLYSFR